MRDRKSFAEVKTVGIWIRVSTDDQARGESPEHHEKRARYYAESKDWNVATVYHLEGVSGKSVLGHAEAQRMLSDMRDGRITGLVFSKIARLARNTRELLDIADEFDKHGADLISLHESIDTTTPAGRLFFTVVAALSEFERAEIAARVAQSIPIRAKLGKNIGGAASFGYKWVDKKLMLDEHEAPIRRLMYELFLEHKRKKTVARLLNEMGHRTRAGAPFNHTTIHRLLTDPIAKGVRRANMRRQTGAGWELKDQTDWILLEAPAVVSEEMWEACNSLIESQSQPKTRRARKAAHLFSGLVYCLRCGPKMYVPTDGKSYTCQQCRNKVRTDDMEAVFMDQLQGFLLDRNQIVRQLEASDNRIVTQLELLSSLETDRAQATSEMDKLYKLYLTDRISDDLFAERNVPLEKRRKQLDDEIPRLQAEVDLLRLSVLSADEVMSEARDLGKRWPGLEHEGKRQIIEALVDRIEIGDNEITIQMAYVPTPPRLCSSIISKGAAKRSRIPRNARMSSATTFLGILSA